MACQIAKLRFFISLAIEQVPDQTADNFGIKPLPNLETRFVAANTLVGLQTESQLFIVDDIIQQTRNEIESIREKYFIASSRKQKQRYIKQEEKLRNRLERALSNQQLEWAEQQKRRIDQTVVQLPTEKLREQLREQLEKEYKLLERELDVRLKEVRKIAHWDPYDQNASADFFDPEWMFGVNSKFDVVIGNPPYINIENLPSSIKDYLFKNYQACQGRTDIYVAFLEKSVSILRGIMCFILPSAFATQKYGEKMRQILIEHHAIREVVDASSYRIFENATVYKSF